MGKKHPAKAAAKHKKKMTSTKKQAGALLIIALLIALLLTIVEQSIPVPEDVELLDDPLEYTTSKNIIGCKDGSLVEDMAECPEYGRDGGLSCDIRCMATRYHVKAVDCFSKNDSECVMENVIEAKRYYEILNDARGIEQCEGIIEKANNLRKTPA